MTGTAPEISVIMSVYNPESRKHAFTAIKSILQQSFSDFEFIIYDDGSDPEIAVYADKIAGLDDRIRIAGRRENHGLAFSLNQCLELTQGRYIARMDADDISLPERLKTQREFLETHPRYAWCGCNIELFDEDGIWDTLDYPQEPEAEDFLRFSPFAHPTVMFRRELFEDGTRYLASEETWRCEDYELFMRLYQKGYRGYNIQEYLFLYRENRNTLKTQKMRFRVNEAKIRYRNFKKMGLLNFKGCLSVLRPIAGGLVPTSLLAAYKRRDLSK